MKPDERLLALIGNIPDEMLDEALNIKKICSSLVQHFVRDISYQR